jgi:tripartite-type tricarboxylate transporter receptor subunit TctC
MQVLHRAGVVAALAIAATFPGAALAQAYPERAITLVNPVAAGGSNESLKSIIMDRVAAALGVPIVMESRSGAGGTIGAAYVARAAPDGYTLLLAGVSITVTNPATKKDLPYDPVRDFTPIAILIETAPLLVVPKSIPASTAKEFVELARAKPGKLNYASYGRGTSNYLAFELFKQAAGIDLVNVPYRGSAPLLVALLAGEVDAAFEYPPTIKPHINAGTFRVLGIASPARSRLFPDVPTLAEQGYPVTAGGTIILAAPAGLPPAIADRLNAEVNKVLAQPDVRQRIMDIGYEPVGGTREEAASWIRSELAKWKRLARDIAYELD